MTSKTKHFTDTIFYQIELTARYTKMLGMQLFGKLGVGLTIEEFSALDTISANKELCQRDLAKLILKDRANTGKLLDSLEENISSIQKAVLLIEELTKSTNNEEKVEAKEEKINSLYGEE